MSNLHLSKACLKSGEIHRRETKKQNSSLNDRNKNTHCNHL